MGLPEKTVHEPVLVSSIPNSSQFSPAPATTGSGVLFLLAIVGITIGLFLGWKLFPQGVPAETAVVQASFDQLRQELKQTDESINQANAQLEKSSSDLKQELQASEKDKAERARVEDRRRQAEESLKASIVEVQEAQQAVFQANNELGKLEYDRKLAEAKANLSSQAFTNVQTALGQAEARLMRLQGNVPVEEPGQGQSSSNETERAIGDVTPGREVRAVVTKDSVIIRDSPSTQAFQLAALNKSDSCFITETGPSDSIGTWGTHPWYKIRLDSGKTGWVFGAFLQRDSSQ